jgi:hypothetical protein
MGTLWLDVWAQPQMTGNSFNSILFDAYNDLTPVLRWFLEFRGEKLFAVLTSGAAWLTLLLLVGIIVSLIFAFAFFDI